MSSTLSLYFKSLAFAFIASSIAWKPLPDAKPANLDKVKAALKGFAKIKGAASRHVLVFSKTNGFRHGSIATGVNAMAMLGEKTGAFKVTASEDEAMFDNETLAKFDAVIMLNTTGENLRPKKVEGDRKAAAEKEAERKQNLVDFVKGGKGLVGMHSATDTYKKWKDYNDMMGGAFAGHPWHQDVALKVLDEDNPITAMVDEGFVVKDEIYQFREDTASPDDRRMLLALSGTKADLKKGKRKDGFYPVSWVDQYGDGRVFYCSLGHRDEIYWNETILKHYLAGIRFALGDLDAESAPLDVE